MKWVAGLYDSKQYVRINAGTDNSIEFNFRGLFAFGEKQ